MVAIDKKFQEKLKPENPDDSSTQFRDSIKDNARSKSEPPMIKPTYSVKNLTSLIDNDYDPLSGIKKYNPKNQKEKKVNTFHIPRLLLPHNVLGMYVPSYDDRDDTIYLASDRPDVEMQDVNSHERAHARLRGGPESITNAISNRGYSRHPITNYKDIERSNLESLYNLNMFGQAA